MPRYAAIDVGSNSIRMEAAEVLPDSPPRILASDREVTRVGQSVFQSGRISQDAIEQTCRVLARMAAAYKEVQVVGVRAVATSGVRDARNQEEFVSRASEAIGAPLEVISGREEARLIHAGVEWRWPHPNQNVLVVDIGGGSAEIIAGEDGLMRDAVSKPLGAVRLREIFLGNDPPSERDLHNMHEYIQERLAGVAHRFGAAGWNRVIGTGGTASAVACAIHGVPRNKRERADRLRVTTAQVRKLYRQLSQLNLAQRRDVRGIGPRRAEIIVAGAAALLNILEHFQCPSLNFSLAGVRDGIIADLAARGIGSELSQLTRDQRREVERMCPRYGVPVKHGRKVATIANAVFQALHPLHQLPPAYGKLLQASAYLHDVGHYVNDLSHHKHSYYLVSNSDISGFTSNEREFIANLCRYHRKALPSPDHPNLRGLTAEDKSALLLLIPILRLADNLDRSGDQRVESVAFHLRNGQAVVELTSGADIELERWAAEQVGSLFQEVYGKELAVVKSTAAK